MMQDENVEIQVLAIGMALRNIAVAIGEETEDKDSWHGVGVSKLGTKEKDECVEWIEHLKTFIMKKAGSSK